MYFGKLKLIKYRLQTGDIEGQKALKKRMV
jgi:hypothetical protein